MGSMISGTPNEVWILNVDVVTLLKDFFSFFQVVMRFSATFYFCQRFQGYGIGVGKIFRLSITCRIVSRIVMCVNRSLMLEMGKKHLSNMIGLHIEKTF